MRLEFDDWQNARIELTEQGLESFRQYTESVGVKRFSKRHGFNVQSVYNARTGRCLPKHSYVKQSEVSTQNIRKIKGPSSSLEIKEPLFPSKNIHELYSRMILGGYKDGNGCYIYSSPNIGKIRRFRSLLDNVGEVEHRIYDRSTRKHLRFPKILGQTLEEKYGKSDHEPCFSVKFDEEGELKQKEAYVTEDESKPVSDVKISKIHGTVKKRKITLLKDDEVSSAVERARGIAENI